MYYVIFVFFINFKIREKVRYVGFIMIIRNIKWFLLFYFVDMCVKLVMGMKRYNVGYGRVRVCGRR